MDCAAHRVEQCAWQNVRDGFSLSCVKFFGKRRIQRQARKQRQAFHLSKFSAVRRSVERFSPYSAGS